MGKLDAHRLRFLTKDEFRILQAVENGMRNHEVVPAELIASIAALRRMSSSKLLKDLTSDHLLSYTHDQKKAGYRLTNQGYDFLALKTLVARGVISSFGNEIGVGKESLIYTVSNDDNECYCLKIHRLGRTCFRNVKNKRDYLGRRTSYNWIYLSRISATNEFKYMTAIYEKGFPIPRPIDCNRHCVVMEHIDGTLLNLINEIEDPEGLYDKLMDLIVQFASLGVIHGDFNEFNILINEDCDPVIIDFPQMVSTFHVNAEMYFNRDVNCVRTFFRKRFNFESDEFPVLSNIVRIDHLDCKIKCSGFSKKLAKETGVLFDDGNCDSHSEKEQDVAERSENESDQEDIPDLVDDGQSDSSHDDGNEKLKQHKCKNKEKIDKDKSDELIETNRVDFLISRMDLLSTHKNSEHLDLGSNEDSFVEENCDIDEIPSEAAAIDPALRVFREQEIAERRKLQKIRENLKNRNKKVASKCKTSITHKARKNVKNLARETFSDVWG